MSCRIKLCTFDVTNTLLKFKLPVGDQYAKVGRIYGVDRVPDKVTKSFMRHWKLMNMNHPNYGQTTQLSSNEWWKELVRRAFNTDSSELTNKELVSISEHLYDLYKTNECWRVAAGAKSLLTKLKEKRIVLGVISNFDERLECVLKSNALHCYFDFILASYDVRVAKPDRKIFDIALGKVPLITASDALHVGDNVMLDYLAAKEAGWNALLLQEKDLNEEALQQVNSREIVHNIEEIEQFLLNS